MAAGSRDRLYNAVLNTIFHDVRMTYDVDGNVEYIGRTINHKEPTTAETWEIWKLTYDVNGNLTRMEGPLLGAWDNRASLDWA